jgi:hypothetical protein
MHPTVSPASVHGDCQPPERSKPLRAQVLASVHRTDDAGEDEEVLLFAAQKGLRLEERNHLSQEIVPIADDEHQ